MLTDSVYIAVKTEPRFFQPFCTSQMGRLSPFSIFMSPKVKKLLKSQSDDDVVLGILLFLYDKPDLNTAIKILSKVKITKKIYFEYLCCNFRTFLSVDRIRPTIYEFKDVSSMGFTKIELL